MRTWTMGKRIGLWLALAAIPAAPVLAADAPAESAPAAAAPVSAAAAPTKSAPAPEAVEPPPHHSLLQDPLRINLGAFYASVTNLAAVGGPNAGAGLAVNLENAFGLSDYNVVGEASLHWRFAQRWRLDLDYFNINRTGTRTLTEDITWNDIVLTAGTEVDSSAKFSDLRTAVGYSFFQRPDKEIGLGLGLHVAQSKTSISYTTTGAAVGSGGASSANITAPLPVLVFYSNFALTNTWAMAFRLDWLSLAYGDYSGEIRAVALDFLYQPYQHVGFGFGWHSLTLNLEVDKTDWAGTIKSGYQGPAAFVTLSY
jgi:hypothetical protein